MLSLTSIGMAPITRIWFLRQFEAERFCSLGATWVCYIVLANILSA